jgi:hypothetical protein
VKDGLSHAARGIGEPAVIILGIPEVGDDEKDQNSAENSHAMCPAGFAGESPTISCLAASVCSPCEHESGKVITLWQVKPITSPTLIPVYICRMRGLVIVIVAVVALAMVRGQPPRVPRPTGPMPAVNVP